MNKKKIIIMLLSSFLLVLCVGAYIARVRYINASYPQNSRIYVAQSESYTDDNNIEYIITGTEYMTGEEFIEKYGENPDVHGEYPQKVIIASVKLTNTGDVESSYFLYRFYVETDTYCNGLCLDSFMQMNSCGMSDTIEPGKSVNAKLIYTIEDDYFSENAWNNLKADDFMLTYGYYPKKVIFELQLINGVL